MSVGHYENFPVASWLCPPAMRGAVQAIYHFARTADDLADEGDLPADQRLQQLQRYRQALARCAAGDDTGADWPQVFTPLRQAIARHALPCALLDDLLDAFVQDTGNPVYADRAALLDYCRRSANPIGRLMLHLAGVHDALSLRQSDAICSALQLINFWQDPSVDLPRGRHYLCDADLAAHGLSRAALGAGDSPTTQALLRSLCGWAGSLMAEGAPLACRVPGRLGWELRLVVQGGLRILERIGAMDYRTLSQRPVLRGTDLPLMLGRALRMRQRQPTPGWQLR
ncbi:MAG: squalene synthase HpnC [Burkholderiales bacterium PBB5]|nr:MAG: squalene synthase HpnC [Burkholderiales bacterium PBB5]